ncbi:ABC transporter ATP-binding protein [Mesorhizobium sp. Z1-4]|uniref:ABC transporter ATP-binding protein n=1 Tax=Mesorhizobium sp. Z1-4 TaxID=2448478 RepID=UPI000FD731D9|nr:ABC transporter ATP-binding protein [Mesorhizobium sp. Z1-4]
MKASAGNSIVLDNLWKTYGSFVAVGGVSLSIEAGKFCTILGPSGSGKTTVLMMLAGFSEPLRGNILIDGNDVTRLPPQKRNLGVVFQNYALFPHMTVLGNVAFPLKMRGMNAAEINLKCRQMLDVVELGDFAGRYPGELSGGQQQRVALARALVFEPRVLLMDEPLGALDKRLRAALQVELKELQRRMNVTVVYVTHDQEEALTMADQVVIMNHGKIEQFGTADDLYDRPTTEFVAGFMGDTNLIEGVVTAKGNDGVLRVEHPTGRTILAQNNASSVGDSVSVSLRPECLALEARKDSPTEEANGWNGRIVNAVSLGDAMRYTIVVGENRPSLQIQLQAKLGRRGAHGHRFYPADEVRLSWNANDARVLPRGKR